MIAFLKKILSDRNPLRLQWHKFRGWKAAKAHGFPSRGLRVIGITGTDGKTTTVGMVAHILRLAGKSVGAASTTFFRINDDVRWNETHKTSVDPTVFQRFLRENVDAKCEFFVAEASSHGLVQGRLGPLTVEVAAITNTSLEHLDYHGSMEQYRRDKGMLFKMLRGRGTKVLNHNDDTFKMYSEIPSEYTIVYDGQSTTSEAQLSLSNVSATPMSVKATLHAQGKTYPLALSVPGLFNLENALCAIGCAQAVGISIDTCIEALQTFRAIPGRMEPIDEGQPFSVFVDFTVTPLAYEKTLDAIRAMNPKRVLVLAGACGNRMREKRPVIGKICSDKAEVVVVTTDETVTEDPLKVMDEVFAGVDPTKTEAHKIIDRREAISFLLKNAKPGDAVALCGMGACSTMQTLTGLVPWDERVIARKILADLGYKA